MTPSPTTRTAVPPRGVPLRARASAVIAPVAMIGGWTAAAAVQPGGFDSVSGTISALAAAPAAHPAIMTAGLAVTGLCHVVTATGLRQARPAGRLVLALGGLGTAAVAATPVTSFPQAHGVAAGVAFAALSLWPALSWRRVREDGPSVLAPRVAVTAAVVLGGLLAWFLVELQQATPTAGALTGLTERVVAGAQSVWPLVVVVALVRHGRPGSRS